MNNPISHLKPPLPGVERKYLHKNPNPISRATFKYTKSSGIPMHRKNHCKGKKGQGMPMNVIIIAVMVLVVLVVLWFIFKGRTEKFATGLRDQDDKTKNFVEQELPRLFGGGQPSGSSVQTCIPDQRCPVTSSSGCPPGCTTSGGSCIHDCDLYNSRLNSCPSPYCKVQ